MKHHSVSKLTGIIGAAASLIAILTWLGVRPPALHQQPPKPTTKKTAAPRATKPKVEARTKVLDGSVSPVAGSWEYHDGTVLIAGKLFKGYGTLSASDAAVTFDAQGWKTFTVSIGVRDDHATPAPEFDVALEVDGQSLNEYRVKAGARAQKYEITLWSHRAVTLRCVRALNADGTPYTGDIGDLVFAEPTLATKGE